MNKKIQAFTLAEVLITIGIIGIVSAMTLSLLVQNYKKQEYVNRLKQGLSILNNTSRLIMTEDEVSNFQDTSFYIDAFNSIPVKGGSRLELDQTSDNFNKFMLNRLNKYIRFSTYRCNGDKDSYCLKKNLNILSQDTYYPKNTTLIMLNNGMSYYLTYIYIDYSNNTSRQPNSACGYAIVDVNGITLPNQLGKDKYIFWMGCDGSWYPQYGATYARWIAGDNNWITSNNYWKNLASVCSVKVQSKGEGCAAKIIEEGWKINY